MPSHRHLYILALGFLAGAFFSPACMGRLNPAAYDKVFVGSGDLSELESARAALEQYVKNQPLADAMAVSQLKNSGVTPVAAEELQADLAEEFGKGMVRCNAALAMARQEVEARRLGRAHLLNRIRLGLLALLLLTMAAEPVLTAAPRLRAGLAAARYGAAAAWIALAIAAFASL